MSHLRIAAGGLLGTGLRLGLLISTKVKTPSSPDTVEERDL